MLGRKQKQVIQSQVLARIAFKNLFYKRLRTSLTILGVVIGIGSIVFLLSLGFGLQKLVASQVIGSKSIKTVDITTPKSRTLALSNQELADFAALSGVEKVAKVVYSSAKVSLGGSQADSVSYGVDQAYLDLSSLKAIAGSVGTENNIDSVVVNTSLLKAAGQNNPKKAVGKTITVRLKVPAQKDGEADRTIDKKFKVRAVVETGSGAEFYVSFKVFEAERVKNATQAKLLVVSRDQLPVVRRQIENRGFSTTSPIDTINQINQIFNLLNVVLVGFGGIGMVIAILGMFNTLTISLLERTKEFGLMISLGARTKDIKRLFIAEALTLALLGGVFGILAALILAALTNGIINSFAARRGVTDAISLFAISPTLMFVSLLFVSVLGYLVVLYPAHKAAHTNPVDAMRR